MDPSVLQWIAEARSEGVVTLAKIVTTLGNPVVLASVVTLAAVAVAWTGQRRTALVYAGTMLAATGLSFALKVLIGRERPVAYFAKGVVETSGSMPSGHAMLSAVAYAGLAFIALPDRKALMMGCVIAAVVGLSRIVLGVHYPTDVLAGWVLALVLIVVGARVARAERVSTPEPPAA